MSLISILLQAVSVYMSKTATFRVGNFQVTVSDVSGKPSHLTIAQAMAVIEAVAVGQSGTFQVGDINVSVAGAQ